MSTVETSFATVLVVAVVVYAAWATLKIDELSTLVRDLRELLALAQREANEGGSDD